MYKNMKTISSRFSAKLLSNVIFGIVSVITAAILPRTLGSGSYGNLHFIRESVTRIFGLIDLNGSLAHFVYSSKNKESKKATFFHTYYSFIVGFLVLLLFSIMFLTNSANVFFPGQKMEYIFLGAILGYLIYLGTNLTNLSDSKEITVGFEIRRVVVLVGGLLFLLLLYFLDLINLRSVFGYYIFINVILVIISVKYLNRKRVYNFHFNRLEKTEIKEFVKYYYNYTHPLVAASVLTFIILYFDRWFLQLIGGSNEQGFFSLAFRVSSICILVTGAMSPIFQQGVAKAFGQNSLSTIQALFQKINLFYFISASIAVFFSLMLKKSSIYLVEVNTVKH